MKGGGAHHHQAAAALRVLAALAASRARALKRGAVRAQAHRTAYQGRVVLAAAVRDAEAAAVRQMGRWCRRRAG